MLGTVNRKESAHSSQYIRGNRCDWRVQNCGAQWGTSLTNVEVQGGLARRGHLLEGSVPAPD